MPSGALSLYLYDSFGYSGCGVYVNSGSVNLWPLSDEPFYSISYNLDGGALDNPRNEYMPTYSNYTLPIPTKYGYTFLGWTGSNGETPQTTVTIPANTTGDLYYTAHWEEAPLVDLTITYVYDTYWGNIKYGTTNEQVTTKTYKVPAGSTVKLYGKQGSCPLYLWAASGSTVIWGLSGPSASGDWVNSGNAIAGVKGVQFVMPSSALSLALNDGNRGNYYVSVYSGSVAINPLSYDTTTYNISYNLDSGSLSNPVNSYTELTNTFTLSTPTKSGYTFLGWTGSNGTTPQTTVTIQQGSIGNKTYTAHWEALPAVLTADSNIKADNIINFIAANKNTTQQICFQGNGTGKFYVKAGSFGSGSSSNPVIYNSGILIYDGVTDAGADTDNFQCAQHLANVMNYILYNTKGSSYGTSSPIFNESSGTSKSFNESTISKGFYGAYGVSSDYYCYGQGYAGYCRDSSVDSYYSYAVWW